MWCVSADRAEPNRYLNMKNSLNSTVNEWNNYDSVSNPSIEAWRRPASTQPTETLNDGRFAKELPRDDLDQDTTSNAQTPIL